MDKYSRLRRALIGYANFLAADCESTYHYCWGCSTIANEIHGFIAAVEVMDLEERIQLPEELRGQVTETPELPD